MPSPFPGMDPYLEGGLWTSFHAQLAVEIARQLVPQLRPRYMALPEERQVYDIPGEDVLILADVGVLETGSKPIGRRGMVQAAPLRLATVMPEPIPHFWVEIRDTAQRRLVTAIEILSPTNKRGGRSEYLEKRLDLLRSSAHLLEIDLLRKGTRLPMKRALPERDYFVFLSRVEKRPMTDIWPIRLQDSLPTVPVPLLAPDGDVSLDLQRALATVYDLGGLDLAIHYTKPPEVRLSPTSQAWAKKLLKTNKRRA